MAAVTEIGTLISTQAGLRGGRPCIAGTGVSVRRIAQWHNMGLIPEEIARKISHLTLAQVHAALTYYHSNKLEIDADLEEESRQADALAARNRTQS
jgi:uncharacterized protein (DUF433 family)